MASQDIQQRKIEVFYSYSHKDQDLRDTLENHLSLLHRQGYISEWNDRKILPGAEWAGEMETASIILLLISADFLASDYCYDKEMTRAMERHKQGKARVIPIILRPVDNWPETPFGMLEVLPKDKPITRWRDRDEAFAQVAKGIRKVVEELMPPLEASPKSQQYQEIVPSQAALQTSVHDNPSRQAAEPAPIKERIEAFTLLHTLTGHRGGVWGVAISPDGQFIVSGGNDETVRVWDLQTGNLLGILIGHTSAVQAVAISPDGQFIVSGSIGKNGKMIIHGARWRFALIT